MSFFQGFKSVAERKILVFLGGEGWGFFALIFRNSKESRVGDEGLGDGGSALRRPFQHYLLPLCPKIYRSDIFFSVLLEILDFY